MKLLFATANAHKAKEVREILKGTGVEVETLLDYPELGEAPETGDTFVHNAFEKAEYVAARTGRTVIADDSGIEVDALDGAPGVHSKFYTPEAIAETNVAKLLREMDGKTDRRARFRCILALVHGDCRDHFDGRCEGAIATEILGDGGFGYDPVFLPDATPGRSMAQLSMDEKNAISHRGRAFKALPDMLRRAGVL